MNPSGRPPWPARERRYDWFRVYNDFVGHPKFRYIAEQCGASISEVSMIAVALFVAANKSKPRGWVRDFDPCECCGALDIPMEKVIAVYRAFEGQDWITEDYLATWDKRQPDKEDPTSTERQQRRRARLKAARGGPVASESSTAPTPTPEQEAVSAKLAAQYWLFSDGIQIVAGRTGEKSLAVELRMKRWLNSELHGDAEVLQEIIRGAAAANLNGDAFRNQVAGRVDAARKLKTVGPPLPMDRPGIIKGGAA